MIEIVSQREKIMTEVRRRIADVFPTSQIDRGFFGQNVDTYDRFFLFDLPEKCKMGIKRRGQYECEFMVAISYFLQASQDEVFSIGNMLLEKIRYAMEIDENLGCLVMSIRMEQGALIWYDEGVLDVELLYVVEYTKDAGWVSNPFK